MNDKQILDEYLEIVRSLSPLLSEEDLQLYREGLSVGRYAQGTHYLEAGVPHPNMDYLAKGLMRIYYIDSKGNEVSIDFLSEGSYTADYERLGATERSRYAYQCLEDCIVITMSQEHFMRCYETIPHISLYVWRSLEESKGRLLERISSFLLSNAEERYEAFITSRPQLFGRVPITHLASYLGVSRQALTKIRKKRWG